MSFTIVDNGSKRAILMKTIKDKTMAKPNTLRELVGKKTAYQWLSEQLALYHTITEVARHNKVSSSAIYKLINDEDMVIVQRVLKKNTLVELNA
jgi:hypothetical protein